MTAAAAAVILDRPEDVDDHVHRARTEGAPVEKYK